MSGNEVEELGPSVLRWLESAVGDKFLAYMLGVDVEAVPALVSGDTPLTGKQAEIVGQVAIVRKTIPPELDAATVKDAIRGWLTRSGDNGEPPVVKRAREHIIGAEPVIETRDELERSLAVLAADAFPAFLLSPDDRVPAWPVSIMTTVLVAGHPEKAKFCDNALLDPILKQVFTKEDKHSGHSGMLYANTGVGGGLQLSMLPEVLLRAAWRNLDRDGTPQALATSAIKELEFARAVLSGKTRPISAKVSFAGILLPEGTNLELGDEDVVRPVTDTDRQSVFSDMAGKASHTDSSGNSVTINYDGDVLLVHRFPYRVRIGKPGDDDARTWFDDPEPHNKLQRVITRLRASLMLAVERERRVQIVEAWRCFDQPLSQGWNTWLGDPRRSTGIHPTRLTEAEVTAWGEWYRRLNTSYVDRIDVALTRILRAASERREPSDLLIDSVIAWENLFGTSEGEPTLRVTTCLALLLEQSTPSRMKLRKRLAEIYRLRSKVVHGNDNLRRDEYPMCHEALDVAVRAIRVLVTDRTDIVELPDGGARSQALLLGG